MAVPRASIDSPDDEFILQHPVSDTRKRRFFENFLLERRLTRTTESLFNWVGALQKRPLPAPPNVTAFGFKSIVFKASFVEGVEWYLGSAQHFARIQEDFLLEHFQQELHTAVGGGLLGNAIERGWQSIIDTFDDMASHLQTSGAEPSLFVIAGQIGQPLYDELGRTLQSPQSWYRQMRYEPRATYRMLGAYTGIPVLDIAESPIPTLYAIDLERFATLTRYGRGPNYDPEFEVKAFTDDEARDVLTRQPNLILEPPPLPGNERERVRQLQLRVGLELWETYKLDVKDLGAVIARPLADPSYE